MSRSSRFSQDQYHDQEITPSPEMYESDSDFEEYDDFENDEDDSPMGFVKASRYSSRNGETLEDQELEYDLESDQGEIRDYLRNDRRYFNANDPEKLTTAGVLAESGHSFANYPSKWWNSMTKRIDYDDLQFEAGKAYEQARKMWKNFTF